MGQLIRRTPSSEGPAPAFRPSPARSTLAAPRTLADPVPERWSSRSLAVAPSYRLAAFLGRGDKMPRIRFYNRRSRHEHPPETPISETACRALWGNPPTFDFETARPFRLSPRRSSGAGPPRGHPTSNGLTLDGVRAGFGPDGYLFSQRPFSPLRLAPFARRGSARALSAQGASADSDPLTPLAGVWIEIRAF